MSQIYPIRKPNDFQNEFLVGRRGKDDFGLYWNHVQQFGLSRFESAKYEEFVQQMSDGLGLHRLHIFGLWDFGKFQTSVSEIQCPDWSL